MKNTNQNPWLKYAWLPVFIMGCFTGLQAQTGQKMLLRSLMNEDSTTLKNIAQYPATVRNDILQACTATGTLIQMSDLQKKTSSAFRQLVNPLEKSEQEKIWSLCRYPSLIHTLNTEKQLSLHELSEIAEDYPKELKDDIMAYGTHHRDIIRDIDRLNEKNALAFKQITAGCPAKTSAALTRLLNYPEAIALLLNNIRTAALTGEIYTKDTLMLTHTLDSLGVVVAEQHTKELEAWKKGLENDETARDEMESASAEFAAYTGYDAYTPTDDDDIYSRHETVYVNVVYQPYPYWLGYPWWYVYPCWYPYPWWYHCGYYCGSYGIVYTGIPTPYYTYWFFHNNHHHHHYNHFSNYCLSHYYGHRESPSGFNREVSHWVNENQHKVPQNFFSTAQGRPERIREFGKFELDYNEAVKKQPDKKLSREEFLNTRPNQYPHLQPGSMPAGKNPAVTPGKPAPKPSREKPVYTAPPVKPKPPVSKTPGKTPAQKPVQTKPKPRSNVPAGKKPLPKAPR